MHRPGLLGPLPGKGAGYPAPSPQIWTWRFPSSSSSVQIFLIESSTKQATPRLAHNYPTFRHQISCHCWRLSGCLVIWSKTPVATWPLAKTRPGLLPSAHSKASAFFWNSGLSLRSTTMHFSRLNTWPAFSFRPVSDSRCRVGLRTSLPSYWLNFTRTGLSPVG